MRYRKHQEKTFQRRIKKLEAEGFKCQFEGCEEKFTNQIELSIHIQAHNQDCWNQLKCNQPKCGKQVCLVSCFINKCSYMVSL